MIKLVIVKNPFQPWKDREIKNVPNGFSLRQAVEMTDFKGQEIYCSVNGNIVEMADNYIIKDNEIVTLSPIVAKSGKSILGIVAMIGLSIAVGGILGGGLKGIWGAAFAKGAWGAYALAAATMFVGSTLIGKLTTVKADTGSNSSDNDQTYSWNGVQTMEGQNNPITMTYGKVKSAGQTIGKFINVDDNNEYLNWLVSAGEGPLTFSNIKINDNPYTNYDNVSIDIRNGTNEQEIISNFNDTYATTSLSYQLLDEAITHDINATGTQGIKIKIEFSNGLYYAKDNGDLGEAWVDIEAYYRKKNTSSWSTFLTEEKTRKIINNAPQGVSVSTVYVSDKNFSDGTYSMKVSYDSEYGGYDISIRYPNGYNAYNFIGDNESKTVGNFYVNVTGYSKTTHTVTFTVSSETYMASVSTFRVKGSQSSAIRKELRVDNIPAGAYEVKVKVKDRQYKVTNSRASTRCWWTEVTSIVYDDFTYPNIALLGIKAKATDQLSGTPSLSFIKERDNVWVWDGTQYVEKPANNPAWASYDMLHLCSRIKDINTNQYVFDVRGAKKELLIYEQFNEWATFCTNKNLKVNIEITQAGELLDIINSNIANCGRGMVVRYGTKYGCVWDAVKQPVQMFGMGNIISGTFNEEFLQTSDRANCVEITYTDARMDYERNTVTIYGDDYDTDAEEKIAQATYNGITSYEQAYREGKYQLYCNKYLLRTVSFDANVDAIACTIGDVILVAHDVPKWAYSGRIYSVNASKNELTLPIEIEDTTKQYRIAYRTVNDVFVESNITIVSNANGWCTVKCSNSVANAQANDIFDIAERNVGSKPFLVKSITRSSDFTRKITCLEYNANIYNENYNVPPINYSIESKITVVDVKNLVAKRNKCISINGDTYYLNNVSWEHEGKGTFNVYTIDEAGKQTLVGSNIVDTSYSFKELDKDSTKVKVVNVYELSYSKGVEANITDLNYVEMASATNISADTTYRVDKDSYVTYQIDVSWTRPTLANYQCCEVWYKSNSSQSNKITVSSGTPADELGYTANWIYAGTGTDSATIQQVTPGDEYLIAVLTKTKAGDIMSFENAPTITYVAERKTVIPNTPSDFKMKYTDKANLTWVASTSGDIAYYEVGYIDSNGNEVIVSKPTDVYCDINLESTNGKLYLYAVNKSGVKSRRVDLEYTEEDLRPAIPTNLQLSFSDKIDLQWLPSEYALNYEVGYTENYRDFKVLETTSTTVSITEPKTRTGTIYVIAKNNLGLKSNKAAVNYSKPKPNAPSFLNIDGTAKTIYAKWSALPSDCLYSHVVVTGTNFLESYDTQATTITVPNIENAGVYNVSVAYVDLFGEGNYITGNYTVELFIDKDLIEEESITEKKLDNSVQNALDKAKISASENYVGQEIDTVNRSINTIVSTLNGETGTTQYSAITSLSDAIGLKVSSTDYKGETIVSKINLSPSTVKIDGKYVHITGDTVFDNNVKINGSLQTGNSIVAGPVTISSTGIELTINSGTLNGQKVRMNGSGLQFVDTNNNVYSTLGRTIIGYAEHGQHVTFGTTWSKVPTVMITPINLYSYSENRIDFKIEQRCKALNVTKTGFDVVCANVITEASGYLSTNYKYYYEPTFKGQGYKCTKFDIHDNMTHGLEEYHNKCIIYVEAIYTGAVYSSTSTSTSSPVYTNKNAWLTIVFTNQNNTILKTLTTTKHSTSTNETYTSDTFTIAYGKNDTIYCEATLNVQDENSTYRAYFRDLHIYYKDIQDEEVVVRTGTCAFTAFESSNAPYEVS